MKTILALLFFLPLSVLPVKEEVHEFHLSRTRIEYQAATQEWQISLHLFIDDLALALEEKGAPPLHLGTEKEAEEADAYIEKYLQRFLQFEREAELLDWEWLGKETSEDLSAFYIYLYIPNAQKELAFRLKNQLFLDLFDDQQNMIQFVSPSGQKQQLLFHRDYWEDNFNASNN